MSDAKAVKPKAVPNPSQVSKPFWEGAKDRRFLLQYDPEAKRYQFFPRPVSLHGSAEIEWREASGRGTLVAITVCRAPAAGFEGDLPYMVGLVRLEEGPRVLARIVNAGEAPPKIGQAMRLTWDESRTEYPVYQFEPVK